MDILDSITKWAKNEDNIKAVILTGSRGRGARVDEFSDYDVELICSDPKLYLKNNDWFEQLGDVAVHLALEDNQPYPTRLVIYTDGTKVDFTIASIERINKMTKGGLDDLYSQGYKVLIDKQGVTRQLSRATGAVKTGNKPSEEEYMRVVREFWFEAAHIPKYLARDDLWVVKFRDWTMKEMILKMLEWHGSGKGNDVKQIGSHMKEWLPAETWQKVQTVFGRLDTKDSWRALEASMDLFRGVSRAVAAEHGFKYPEKIDQSIGHYIDSFKSRFTAQ